jgi:hypothetical protein
VHDELSTGQVLEVLDFLRTSETNLIPIVTVLSGIKSLQVIQGITTYISESLGPYYLHKLRKQNASKDLFEVFFLILELSDQIAISLYDAKVLKQASRRCKQELSLFPVPLTKLALI